MRTWDDYKKHAKSLDSEIAKDIDEIETAAKIVTSIINQRNALGLSQRELAEICNLPQSSIARIESCKTMPNLSTLLNICKHLSLQISITPIA